MRPGAAAVIVLPAILVNAGVQSLLVVPDPTAGLTVGFLAGALTSAALALAVFAVIVATTLATDRADVGVMLRRSGPRFTAWTLGLAVVVVLGFLLPTRLIGYLVLAAAVYVPIAAMASRDNPVRAGLAAIRHRPLAYLLRIVVTIVVAGVLFVLVVLASFFIGGWIATAMTVTVVGLVVWWLTRLWARAFERARAGTISV